jgi:hypothetical protein
MVRFGSRLCETAKELDRDRRNYSSRTTLDSHGARPPTPRPAIPYACALYLIAYEIRGVGEDDRPKAA